MLFFFTLKQLLAGKKYPRMLKNHYPYFPLFSITSFPVGVQKKGEFLQ
jgi:hypothetical protein